MLPKDLTKDLKDRLSSIKGQVEGVMKMLDEDRDPDQILNQFKAADQGLQKAHYLLLDDVFRKSLALKLVQVMNACPGNCPDAQKIELLKKQFPILKENELTRKIKEINGINERIVKYNQENQENYQK